MHLYLLRLILFPAIRYGRSVLTVLIVSLLLCSGIITEPVMAQSTLYSGSLQLDMNPGMRSMALGNNSIALADGTYGIHHNPSMIGFADPLRVDHSFFVRPGRDSRSQRGSMYQFLGTSARIGNQIFLAVAGHRFASTDRYKISTSEVELTESIKSAALAWRASPNVAVGVNLEQVGYRLDLPLRVGENTEETASALGFGVAATYRKSQQVRPDLKYRFTVGSGIQNLVNGQMKLGNEAYDLPTVLRIGMQHELLYLNNGSNAAFENTYRAAIYTSYENVTKSDEQTRLTLGLEISLFDILYFRNGFSAEKNEISFYQDPTEIHYYKQWTYGAGVGLPMRRVAGWKNNVTIQFDLYRSPGDTGNDESHQPFGLNLSLSYSP